MTMERAAQGLDAHARPPPHIRDAYKRIQKLPHNKVADDDEIIDTERMRPHEERLLRACNLKDGGVPADTILSDFCGSIGCAEQEPMQVFEVQSLPGLFVYPSLLPPEVQIMLLERLFHRDLNNPAHKTNVHMHYNVPYPSSNEGPQDRPSYFSVAASDLEYLPKDTNVHKPISTHQYLTKKLRWMTLGGQYDWTNKVYPEGPPPEFPPDVKGLVEGLFPMKAEAAIVNLYSPGDTLSLHRDVSEECQEPLVSISLGCEGLFVIGLDGHGGQGDRVATLRLRSGDAVLMDAESRYAWHGVPKILDRTCPDWMATWPGEPDANGEFEHWRNWMQNKRINLNVRQMFEHPND